MIVGGTRGGSPGAKAHRRSVAPRNASTKVASPSTKVAARPKGDLTVGQAVERIKDEISALHDQIEKKRTTLAALEALIP